jgi:vacuolar-type H+-ATPase subunit I/STV1
VAKLVERVSKDEFMTILSKIKKLGGYYYKYKGGFIFSENPTELLKENFSQSESAEEKNISNDINLESVAGYIVDNSSTIIDNMNLSKAEYWNNEEYKNKLLQVIKDRKLTKNQFKNVIDCIQTHEEYREYKRLIEVLKGFYALNNNDKNNSNKVNDKEKNISKIDKQLESNNNKIEKLSGEHLTNTWNSFKRLSRI